MDSEEMLETEHPKVRMAYHSPFSQEELQGALNELREVVTANDDHVRSKLISLAVDYRPSAEQPGVESSQSSDHALAVEGLS